MDTGFGWLVLDNFGRSKNFPPALMYTTVQSDFGYVTLANEEALEQTSLARGGVT